MEFLDARRLTGPNICCDKPGSILDIACSPNQIAQIRAIWEASISVASQEMGWPNITHIEPLEGGVSLVIEAPIDALYAASAVNEWAWQCIQAELNGEEAPGFDTARHEVDEALADEQNSQLITLQESAATHQTAFLWDDDEASLGMGYASKTWSVKSLPDPSQLDWDDFSDIPVGVITGTNGKTTCTRIVSQILQSAGFHTGISCTDWLAVNDEIIDEGDWSGPGGARTILRQSNVTAAILETARGGLLRRGLGITRADAALITNIAEDHLGDFGSHNLDELLNIKWIVSRAVRQSGTLVLNADDPRLVEKAKEHTGIINWFSLNPESEVIAEAVNHNQACYVLSDGNLIRLTADSKHHICAEADIPLTIDGAAKHNTANSLAAAALTHAMGVELTDIGHALTNITQAQNPGRSNVHDIGGVKVVIDFAHNPHAMAALFQMAQTLPAKRRLLAFGQAGDRPDHSIRDLSRAAWSIGLDKVFISELAAYHRGRDYGEVFGIIRSELLAAGATPDNIKHFDAETDAFHAALDWAEPGDLIIMLALGEREQVRNALAEAMKNR